MAGSRRRHKRRIQAPQIWAVVGVGAIAVVVALLVGLAMKPAELPTSRQPTFVATTPPPITRAPVSAYFIGDSITAGAGAPLGHGYTDQVKATLNWQVTVDAIGGAGFANPGPQPTDGNSVDASFSTRLPDIVAAQPDVVVVAGGRNDLYEEEAEERIEAFFTDLRQQLPDATIVAISPWHWARSSDVPSQRLIDETSETIREAAEAVDGTLIDAQSEIIRFTDADAAANLSDEWHPNAAGYKLIGADLARVLVEHGLPRGPERWRQTGFQTNEWVDPSDKVLGQ